MTRRQYEAQQIFKRDRDFEASIKYQNQPHSFRGNLLRIRSVGGKCIIWLQILVLFCFAAVIAFFSLSGKPALEYQLSEEQFTLDSYYKRGRISRPCYYLLDSRGTQYVINNLAFELLSRNGIEQACVQGANVTVGVEYKRTNAAGKLFYFCDTLAVNGKEIMTYEDYLQVFRSNRTTGIVFACGLAIIGALFGCLYVHMVRHMDRHPKFICREFGIRQLPPVWKEIRHREEKAYLRRHADKK